MSYALTDEEFRARCAAYNIEHGPWRGTISKPSDPRLRPTPGTTVDAVMYCVRERGQSALKEPANVERLSRCDDAAHAEIKRRISALRGQP
jgi:hypothetical protein